jgi:hypothetical protein
MSRESTKLLGYRDLGTAYEYITRLDVPMDDSYAVQILDPMELQVT